MISFPKPILIIGCPSRKFVKTGGKGIETLLLHRYEHKYATFRTVAGLQRSKNGYKFVANHCKKTKLSNGNGQEISEMGPSHCFVLSLIFPIDTTDNDKRREARRD